MSGAEAWMQYRRVYALLAPCFQAHARCGGGADAHRAIESELLHKILHLAGFGGHVKLQAIAGPDNLLRAVGHFGSPNRREYIARVRRSRTTCTWRSPSPPNMPITSIRGLGSRPRLVQEPVAGLMDMGRAGLA
jgi:hypothetical protein